jgi:hypothetical protein
MSESSERRAAEHLSWCKARALEYLDTGDLMGAVGSMTSDLQKHSAWSDLRSVGPLFLIGAMNEANGDAHAVRRWVEGWN